MWKVIAELKRTLLREVKTSDLGENTKKISLETMDGYEFQKFVAGLFKQLGFKKIKLGPRSADGGIDITMQQRSHVGSVQFTVECKHHPKSSIGRPVVQKIHSAVLHTPVLDKGIIVTSGHFSSPAIKYAEEVGIELIDIEELQKLAEKVGFSLEKEPSLLIDNCFPISKKSIVIDRLCDFLQKDLKGFSANFLEVEEVGLELLSAYMIDFSINATFSTSVGVIASLKGKETVFLDATRAELIDQSITDALFSRSSIGQLSDQNLEGVKLIEKGEFVKDFKEIKEEAIETLRQQKAQKVSYYGANNRRYTKICTPKKKDITLLDTKRVYLPIWSFVFSILDYRYGVVVNETPQKLNILPLDRATVREGLELTAYPNKCMICSELFWSLKNEKYVCNECGKIICDDDSSECKLCEKVLCKEHTISQRKFLVLSNKYCSQCAKSEGVIS